MILKNPDAEIPTTTIFADYKGATFTDPIGFMRKHVLYYKWFMVPSLSDLFRTHIRLRNIGFLKDDDVLQLIMSVEGAPATKNVHYTGTITWRK